MHGVGRALLWVGGIVAVAVITAWVTGALRWLRDRTGRSLIVSVDPNGFMQDSVHVGEAVPAPDLGDEAGPVDPGEAGLVALGWQSVRLTARGGDARAVVIKRIRVRVTKRSHPAWGWYVLPERGGGLDVREFDVDLDEADEGGDVVAALVAYERGRTLDVPTRTYNFTVSESDPESWELTVSGSRGLVRWRLEVDYEVSGHHHTKKLENEGFVVTGPAPGQRAFSWEPDETWREWGERPHAAADDAPAPPLDDPDRPV